MKNVRWLLSALCMISNCAFLIARRVPLKSKGGWRCKRILLFLLLISSSAFAQIEHGLLLGAGVGFPLQDGWKETTWGDKSNWTYRHDHKFNSMIGYRFRFLPEKKIFYDLDVTMGFQKMETTKYFPYFESIENGIVSKETDAFNEFVMPISIAASWNWRFTKKFYLGLGIAPTLYVQPQAVFDVSVMAKVGYRLSKHCELGLSYQYGCLNTLNHFNDGPANGRRGHLSDLMLSVYIPFVLK